MLPKLSPPFAFPAVLLAGLLLGGCATTTTPPAAPVAPIAKARPATITGSEESSALFDNLTAFVSAVDGQPVKAGRDGWNIPLALPAGPHQLTVEFGRGVFAARAVLPLTARPEAVYQLKFTTDAQVYGRSSYCEFWIVDTTSGQSVTAPIRVPLTRLAGPK
ncbi:MAG: hypothetical protein ABUL61_02415 [Oleiharenicola lentus]